MKLNKLLIGSIVGYLGVAFVATAIFTSRDTESKETTEPLLKIEQTATADLTKDKKVKTKTARVNGDQVIYLNTPIVDETVDLTLQAIEAASRGEDEIYLVLNSPGGSVLAGARLINFMKNSGVTIHTVCEGLCASMAAQIHQVGKTRYMTPGSVLMFHPASGGVQGTMEQMSSQLGAFSRLVDRMDMEVAKRSGIDYKEFKARLESEYWLESQDAINDGLADSLILLVKNQPQGGFDVGNSVDKLGLKINVPAVDVRTRGDFYR